MRRPWNPSKAERRLGDDLARQQRDAALAANAKLEARVAELEGGDLPIDLERLARSAFDSFLLELGIVVEHRFAAGRLVGPWHELDERLRAAWIAAMAEGVSHASRRVAFETIRLLRARVEELEKAQVKS